MPFKYPLLENAFSNQDINSAIRVVKSRRLTMSKKTMEFEKKLAIKNSIEILFILTFIKIT